MDQQKDGKLTQSVDLFIPTVNQNLIDFARSLNGIWIGAVPILPKPFCKLRNCHNNVFEYIEGYGGERIIGYYLLVDQTGKKYFATLHSIVKTFDNRLIDITPVIDERTYNMFCIIKNQTLDYSLPIISYKIGDAKMDVTENSFKGLSL